MSQEDPGYRLRGAGPAERQLNRLPEGTAVAIVEFLLGALLDNPHRLGGLLQRELAGMRSARRGAYRIVYEIAEAERLVIIHRIEHRSTVYRQRLTDTSLVGPRLLGPQHLSASSLITSGVPAPPHIHMHAISNQHRETRILKAPAGATSSA